MRINRRAFLLSSAAGLVAAPGYAKLIEPGWLELTRHRISIPGLRLPLRVLHLSDLHGGSHTPFSVIEEAIALGLAEKPDLAFLTGDYITFGKLDDPDRYRSVLRALAEAVPVYATFGNHDGGPWATGYSGADMLETVRELLESAGIVTLRNEATVAGPAGGEFNLVGLGDYWAEDCRPDIAFPKVSEASWPTLLLNHNPDVTAHLGPYRWQLQLSGHTHGGQVVIPVFGPPYVPVVDNRFIRGLCQWEGRPVYITRGVGAIHGVRFNCRPEVTVLDLVPA